MASAHLAPVCAARTSFAGFVRVDGDELKVCVRDVRYNGARTSFEHAQLDVEPRLAAILAAQHDTLKARRELPVSRIHIMHQLCDDIRLAQSSSLDGFVRELEELIAICTPTLQHRHSALPPATYYTHLMAELDAIGWHRVLALSDDLRSLELESVDATQRKHALRLELPVAFPGPEPPTCYVDAPEPFELLWTLRSVPSVATIATSHSVLTDVLQQFDAFVARHQAFWDVLDDLDAHTCVLEPHRPTRATGRRRIALEKHASVQLDISAKHPRALCDLRFFGSDATVGQLRARWSERAHEWDDALLPRINVAAILDVSFPSPLQTAVDEFAVECGICYCYRLEVDASANDDSATAVDDSSNNNSVDQRSGAVATAAARTIIPDKLCENVRCSRPFHEKCLFDWLKALPTARQSFNTVFGECPYCRDAISAKFLP